jgi:hypothetical protein
MLPRVGSAMLEAFMPRRAGSASLEGSTPPLEQCPPRSRAECPLRRGQLRSKAPTRTCSRMRVRAFNALMPQGRAPTLTCLVITPRRCSANSRGEAIPAAVQHCAARRCQLRDTMSPTPVRLIRRALDGGPAAPSNISTCLYRTTPRRQASGIGHPRRCQPCAAIPVTAAPRRTLW